MIITRGDGFGVSVYDPDAKAKVWIGTWPTKELALAEEARAKARFKARPGRETCDGFARRWTIDFARPSRNTNRARAYAVKPFIRDFAGKLLASMTRVEAYAWAQSQSQNTTDAVHVMFTDAIDAGLYIGENPFGKLRRRRSRGRRDLDALSSEETFELAACASTVWGEYGTVMIGPLILFQSFVTTRPAELCFIERTDVRGDYVYVLDSDDGAGEPKDPKNGNKRRVLLPFPAAEAVKLVPPRINVPWLFYTKTGRQFSKSSLFYYWNPVRAAFGRPDLELYALRHAGASIMTNELDLDDEDVAIQMGHTDGGHLVRTLYGHRKESLALERIKREFDARFKGDDE